MTYNLLLGALLNAVQKNLPYFIIIVAAVIIIAAAFIIRRLKQRAKYSAKDALLTLTEIEYYDLLRMLVAEEYYVFPQINLASVIDKQGGQGGRTELFRNIDFGIFDREYKPLVLVEINDNSHLRPDRAERDKKVAKICKDAKIPLVTFWVKDGIDIKDMRRALKSHVRLRTNVNQYDF